MKVPKKEMMRRGEKEGWEKKRVEQRAGQEGAGRTGEGTRLPELLGTHSLYPGLDGLQEVLDGAERVNWGHGVTGPAQWDRVAGCFPGGRHSGPPLTRAAETQWGLCQPLRPQGLSGGMAALHEVRSEVSCYVVGKGHFLRVTV